LVEAPAWLACDWLLSQFGSGSHKERAHAYSTFVQAGADAPDPLEAMYKPPPSQQSVATAAATLQEFSLRYPDYREAIHQAYRCGAYTQAEIARHFDVSRRTVTRLVRDRRTPK
jgi:putative transposase